MNAGATYFEDGVGAWPAVGVPTDPHSSGGRMDHVSCHHGIRCQFAHRAHSIEKTTTSTAQGNASCEGHYTPRSSNALAQIVKAHVHGCLHARMGANVHAHVHRVYVCMC